MHSLFRNFYFFTVIYFVVLTACILLRLLTNHSEYTFLYRSLTFIPLFIYYFQNSTTVKKKIRLPKYIKQ